MHAHFTSIYFYSHPDTKIEAKRKSLTKPDSIFILAHLRTKRHPKIKGRDICKHQFENKKPNNLFAVTNKLLPDEEAENMQQRLKDIGGIS